MERDSIIAQNEIVIKDYNSNEPVVFSNLSLHESMVHVNRFSFSMRPTNIDGGMNAVIDLKKSLLAKDVEISFKSNDGQLNYVFNGTILEVDAHLVDERFYEFVINGGGLFAKTNYIPECRSFYNKDLKAIIDDAVKDSSLKQKIKHNPVNTTAHHYIVQYNQSVFDFVASLAIRFGEWMYYDGKELQFGDKPSSSPIELRSPNDVFHVNLHTQALRAAEANVGFDIFKSEIINANTKENPPGNTLIEAGMDKGKQYYENTRSTMFVPSAFNETILAALYKKEQQSRHTATVYLSASSNNSKLGVGKVIKITEPNDTSGKSFIITQISHAVPEATVYTNHFTAVPLDVVVPPYTNPLYVVKASPQSALVTDNEDDAGLARIKVKFPWMKDNEKSPWISVVVPHAGKNKGFRFLPEVDDEVIVDFWDNNIETPFVAGSIYTQRHTAGIAEAGNHVKTIGTRSGREIRFDDDAGFIAIVDSLEGDSKNLIRLDKNDNYHSIGLESKKTADDFSSIIMDNSQELKIGVISGGVLQCKIVLKSDGPVLQIMSKGNIEIEADQKISMKAMEIEIEASNSLKMKGTTKAVVEGMNVELTADTQLKAKGNASAAIEGGANLELKGGAVASLQGGIVKIN